MNFYSYKDAIVASDLTVQQRMVALVIASHYNWKENKPAYPSNITIAKQASVSVRTVVRSKNVLVEKGFLLSTERKDNTNIYYCVVPESRDNVTVTGHHGQAVLQGVSDCHTNNEYNNEVNNELNNKEKDSSESLVNINYIELEEIEHSSTINEQPLNNKESEPRPAAIQEKWLSW